MELIFLYGQAASGKLTVARRLAEITGYALFHNHLIVDSVMAVFPFGSPQFVALREEFWMRVFSEAAIGGRSLIFTFAPEPSVAAGFPERVRSLVESQGGAVTFVALDIDLATQERRIGSADRAQFGKLTDLILLRELKPQFDACMAAMPTARLRIDTAVTTPDEAAARIAAVL